MSEAKDAKPKSGRKPVKAARLGAAPAGDGVRSSSRRAVPRPRGWRARLRHPIFRFVVTLLILLGVFELLLITPVVREKLIPPYLEFYARLSGAVIQVMGETVTVSGAEVRSPRYSVNIKRGCDAMQPSVLFIAAVLAAPVIRWLKLPGLILGLLFLMVMNLVRVVSLYYIGVHFSPTVFDVMHHDVWQATFIFLSILAWAVWALWATAKTVRVAHGTV